MISSTVEKLEGIPVFCVKTTDESTGRKLFINFKSTDKVEQPPIDLDEDQLVNEIRHPSPNIEKYKIPLKLSQIFWSHKVDTETKGRYYVIDVHINDKFAIRRVLVSDVIRHYVVIVTLQTIEEKYNKPDAAKLCGQFIGHQLNLDQAKYEILTMSQRQEKSSELVNNKVVLVEEVNSKSTTEQPEAISSDTPYDLLYRPGSRILTCSISTDKLPDSVSFNDDRIIVECSGKNLIDVHLPIYIDLKEPMKYKFDDKLCLFRVVFRVVESS